MDPDAVLIYDGECPYCSVAATALKRLDDVEAISWYDDAAQTFLAAQFEEVPFAMVLADNNEGRVYAGRAAAKELTDRAGMPGLLGSLVRDNYNTIAKVVGVASGRGRDPDDVHSSYQMAPAATDLFDVLVEHAEPQPEELS
ncbi:DUF393 domain-containing protein [Haloferax mediterranei ATCC 33500]|uniref:DUF393 domain-containing protein n=1 Tax=Haloferax mediterranei (strain ATCC 33500 / DSM 1411 / JCM 8866 / NBRC 14739 / NCIMB 2177 / R-4) TaxID=523841 RepID=I3R5I6_HALMT|nr:DCC1-like thiol-disulfide oxidoreductase family protein [Haloferax mediterranei]AFK19496.1 hypothetical protein HFX_1792 [Haloferax mediterranei ATCC 33500]AHZ21162.1 hypothetical protein BM92_00140 [Haloferax mediterranei ATCC 33500]EMA04316.1 hypothetical protein C439_01537 [Haloferax mediterranei ATCC 33500]MDX5989599.1 DCC1-like thiol-disulfide oxidoreductase family protein [Haloferax mediterranei ATCC 33500]QCQ75955.1 DUF393 domain-containing protein [Haloferax mediterranei ATCC 33500]